MGSGGPATVRPSMLVVWWRRIWAWLWKLLVASGGVALLGELAKWVFRELLVDWWAGSTRDAIAVRVGAPLAVLDWLIATPLALFAALPLVALAVLLALTWVMASGETWLAASRDQKRLAAAVTQVPTSLPPQSAPTAHTLPPVDAPQPLVPLEIVDVAPYPYHDEVWLHALVRNTSTTTDLKDCYGTLHEYRQLHGPARQRMPPQDILFLWTAEKIPYRGPYWSLDAGERDRLDVGRTTGGADGVFCTPHLNNVEDAPLRTGVYEAVIGLGAKGSGYRVREQRVRIYYVGGRELSGEVVDEHDPSVGGADDLARTIIHSVEVRDSFPGIIMQRGGPGTYETALMVDVWFVNNRPHEVKIAEAVLILTLGGQTHRLNAQSTNDAMHRAVGYAQFPVKVPPRTAPQELRKVLRFYQSIRPDPVRSGETPGRAIEFTVVGLEEGAEPSRVIWPLAVPVIWR